MDNSTVAKVAYWQDQHREAGRMLNWEFRTMDGSWFDYYDGDDWSYVSAWQKRQAYCYRQIQRHRGF